MSEGDEMLMKGDYSEAGTGEVCNASQLFTAFVVVVVV